MLEGGLGVDLGEELREFSSCLVAQWLLELEAAQLCVSHPSLVPFSFLVYFLSE
jgi:hypothetical protein